MLNIYNCPVTVYKGVSYNPDGSLVPYEYETVWVNPEDDPMECGGEYDFYVNGEEIVICGTLGNAAEYESFAEYACYADYEAGKPPIRQC